MSTNDASEGDAKDEAQRRIAAMAEPREGQVFRHYKGGLYAVKSVSIMEDTLEILVTYTSNLKGGDTTRTLKNFTGPVTLVFPHGDGSCSERIEPRFRREDA